MLATRRLPHLCLILWLLVGIVPVSASATMLQESPPDEGRTKYWIFFEDKGDAVVQAPITPRAAARRAHRGEQTSAWLDAPVAPSYVDALRRAGVEPLVTSRWLNAVSAEMTAEQVRVVDALPFVRGLRPVARGTASATAPVSPVFLPPMPAARTALDYGPSARQLEQINAIAPLERGINGSGVLLGFLDAEFGGFGQTLRHPAFARLRDEGRLLADSNFVGVPQTAFSAQHGQNVASVAVGFAEGQLIGPAYGATVITATTENTNSETNQEEDNLVRALEWMEALGVDVVNISLGYTEFDPGQRSYTYADLDGDKAVTTIAADRAAALGVVVVTSAGNEGGCASPAQCWYYIGTPADGDSVIAVGAVTPDGFRASFSSFGPTADGRTKPDVSAPGTQVVIAAGTSGYGVSNGTSFASPLVAGVVAQILQVNPNLTPIEVRGLLRETASQSAQPDNALGWGIINADAAIQRAVALDVAPVPRAYQFAGPYPNPSRGRVTFEVQSPAHLGEARLSLFDLLGRAVAPASTVVLSAGTTAIDFDASALAPGLYLYVIEGSAIHESGRIVVVP